jgi:hypothetical protein
MKRTVSSLMVATMVSGVGMLGRTAHADEVVVQPPPVAAPQPVVVENNGNHPIHEYYTRRGWRMEKAGIVMAVIGTALVITGSAVAATQLQGHHDNWTGGATAGVLLLAPGALLTGIGIPLWAVGDSAGRRRVEVSMGPTGVVGRF